MSDYMDARNIGYWLQRIYHDLAGSTMVYVDARKDEYWLQQIYKELTGIDLVGDQRSFDWWSEAIYRHIVGDSSTVKGTVPANVSWQLIYASRASAAYPDGSSALSVEFWIQQAQRVGLESSAPIGPTLLIHDTFTDVNGALPAHTIAPVNTPGTSWTAVRGTGWQIVSNEVSETAGNGDPGIVAVDTGITDMDVRARCKKGSAGDVGIFARQNASSGWLLRIDGANSVELVEVNSPAFTVRDSAVFVLNNATYYELRIVCSGNTITGYIDGVEQVTFTSATFNGQTGAGLETFFNTSSRMDDFKVYDV